MPRVSVLVAAIVSLASVGPACASLVRFNGDPSVVWSGGSFSSDLSGDYPDGFYNGDLPQTASYNGYGQNDEVIIFNRPATLISLAIGACEFCIDTQPSAYQVTLSDAVGNTLATEAIAPTAFPQALTFDTPGVKAVTFGFIGGADAYGDGRQVAFYEVADVRYAAVPEPGDWVLMLIALTGAGAAVRARRGGRAF